MNISSMRESIITNNLSTTSGINIDSRFHFTEEKDEEKRQEPEESNKNFSIKRYLQENMIPGLIQRPRRCSKKNQTSKNSSKDRDVFFIC